MASAAEAKDGERLSAYIDFPKLRESTKAQIKAQAVAEMTSGETSGFEALGTMIGMSMVDAMIDGMLTPQGMTAMFAKERAKPASDEKELPNQRARPFGIDASNRVVVREGLNRFSLHDKAQAGRAGDLIFERHGLSWKLAEIRMPEDVMKKPTRGDQSAEGDAG